MSRFPSIAMCIGLGMLAAGTAASARADAPPTDGPASQATGRSAGSESVPIKRTREKRVGTRLETVIVLGGAVDRHNQRFVDSGAATAVLPTVSESAFLDGEDAAVAESR
jgi:hypothetical protein